VCEVGDNSHTTDTEAVQPLPLTYESETEEKADIVSEIDDGGTIKAGGTDVGGGASIIDPLSSVTRTFSRCACYLLLFSYELWAEQSLTLLHCVDVGGHSVVAEHPDVNCRSDEYRPLQAAAIMLTGVVVIGFPVGLLYFLWINRRRGRLQNDRFKGLAGLLYEHYIPQVQWWWLSQELLRRTLLVTIHVTSAGQSALRGWLLGTACGLILCVHVWFKPYHTHHETEHRRSWWETVFDPNLLETVTLFVLMIAAFTGEVVGESGGNRGAQVLLAMGEGKGFMFWVLILTLGALCVPASWEFACSDSGILSSAKRGVAGWRHSRRPPQSRPNEALPEAAAIEGDGNLAATVIASTSTA